MYYNVLGYKYQYFWYLVKHFKEVEIVDSVLKCRNIETHINYFKHVNKCPRLPKPALKFG